MNQQTATAPAANGSRQNEDPGKGSSALSLRNGDAVSEHSGKELATLADVLSGYDGRQFNLLHPVLTIDESLSAQLSPYVTVVRIDPTPQTGQVYQSRAFHKQDEFALSGAGLALLAKAAGVRFIVNRQVPGSRETFVEDLGGRPFMHVVVSWESEAAVLLPNGAPYSVPKSKTIDTRILAQELWEKDLTDLDKGWNKDRNSGRVNWTEEDIPGRVRQRLIQILSNIDALAESKSQNRTFRALLSVKSKYTSAELQRPFVVPQFLVRPDLTDPAQFARVQLEGRSAAESLYGAPSLPASTQASGVEEDGVGSEEPPTAQQATGVTAESRLGKASEVTTPAAAAVQSDTGTEVVNTPDDRPEPPGWGDVPKPRQNPVFQDGEYRGQTFEIVARDHPEFMKAIAETGRTKIQREAATEWIAFWNAYQNPKLGGES